MEAIGFFKKLFSAGKIKKEIEALRAKIASLESNNKELTLVLNKLQEESDAIEREIAEYAKKLAEVGLTPKDIIEEYKLILAEIEERKTKPQEAVVEETPKVQTVQSPAPRRKTPDYRGMSQVEKFRAREEARLAKLAQQKKEGQSSTGSEKKQQGEE